MLIIPIGNVGVLLGVVSPFHLMPFQRAKETGLSQPGFGIGVYYKLTAILVTLPFGDEKVVEVWGFEPQASSLRTTRSTN
jgi:hypothetical protein